MVYRVLLLMLSVLLLSSACSESDAPDDVPVMDEPIDPKKDTDADGVPDLVEMFAGTSPSDPAEAPKAPRTKGNCPTGWSKREMLCWSNLSSYATRYYYASLNCRGMVDYYKAPIRVANYEDLSYLYISFPNLAASYNPRYSWIGNIVGDDKVLCGNKSITSSTDPDRYNFEGRCNKTNSKRFWCVMDLGVYDAAN